MGDEERCQWEKTIQKNCFFVFLKLAAHVLVVQVQVQYLYKYKYEYEYKFSI